MIPAIDPCGLFCEQTKGTWCYACGPVHLMKQMAHSVLCTTFYVLWYVVLKIFFNQQHT